MSDSDAEKEIKWVFQASDWSLPLKSAKMAGKSFSGVD